MELLFKKYFWILNSVLLVGGGYVTSRAISSYVEYELFTPRSMVDGDAEEEFVEEGEFQFRRPLALRSVDLERRRQLALASVVPKEEEEPVIEKVDEEAAPEEIPTDDTQAGGDLGLELVASITSMDEARSMALVRVDGGDTRWVGIGDELKAGYKVTRISNYYIAASQGVTELLWKKQEKQGPKPVLASGRSGPSHNRKPPPTEKAKPKRKKKTNPYADGIKQTGPFEYNIDRGMLNEQLQDLAKLGREARVIPNYDKDSGSYKGFKLIGVRPNSLYRAIGIRSGDVINQINGEELSSPGKALELFTKLQNSSGISLDITRRGKAHTMSYKIE